MILFSVPIPSFSYSFPLWFIIGYWIKFPMLYNRILLIQPKCHVLHLLFPKSQSNPSLLSLTPQQPQVSSLCQRVCFVSHLSPFVYDFFLSSVQSLNRVRLFATPWTAARQASLSITNSQSPPKPMSVEYGESVVISHWNHCFFGAFICTIFFFSWLGFPTF